MSVPLYFVQINPFIEPLIMADTQIDLCGFAPGKNKYIIIRV